MNAKRTSLFGRLTFKKSELNKSLALDLNRFVLYLFDFTKKNKDKTLRNRTSRDNTLTYSATAPKSRRARRALADLPQYYYHTHFCEMLDVIDQHYAVILNPNALDFLNTFGALSFTAQCAYIRIAGRKGHVFDIEKFNYPEIQNLDQAINELRLEGFVCPITQTDKDHYLNAITKDALIQHMRQALCTVAFKPSWTKPRLLEIANQYIHFDALNIPKSYISQGRIEALHYLLFLFFGRIETTLQPFTLRDLGLVKASNYDSNITARFDTQEEAESVYFYEKALHDFRHGTDETTAHLIDNVENWPSIAGSRSEIKRDKLLYQLGGLSERLTDIETALSLYQQGQSDLCNEREIRLLYKRNKDNDRTHVKTRLEEMIDNPCSDGEHDFACDFYSQKFKKKKTSAVTDMLRCAETLSIDEAFKGSPERAAKLYYENEGYFVSRTENAPWRLLFGLLFWDRLFGIKAKSIHSPFERLPSSLKSGEFYDIHKEAIEQTLETLNDKGRTLITLLKTATQNHGTPNGIFRWRTKGLETLQMLVKYAPSDGLKNMMRLMAQNYETQKVGYPDLMRLKDGKLSFIEVKSEGDVIRRNQLTRMRQMKTHSFDVDIAKLNWIVDPQQIYVVVDIETTGGRASTHRVTEIGAVKIQGGEVIDEWQSLINPQRSIPASITRLTGISEQMVADAPVFAEVANEFADFMGEAIFVAHNVNFDYGFLTQEFDRLNRRFRFPKLCTCASMRKYYPGYRSYSLKNLTDAFQIDLKSHHRALCDAKAAAELLKLINYKRLENA